MKHIARQTMATFTEIELQQRAAPASLVVNEIQRVDGLVDATNFSDGLGQPCRSLIKLQGAHDSHRGHQAEFERANQTQYVIPMRRDAIKAYTLSCQGIEFAIVGTRQNRVPPMSARRRLNR